jgi:hypothetical protein
MSWVLYLPLDEGGVETFSNRRVAMHEEVQTHDLVRPFGIFMKRCQPALPRFHRIMPDDQLSALNYILGKDHDYLPEGELEVKAAVIERLKELCEIMAHHRAKFAIADIEVGAYLFANACQCQECWDKLVVNEAEVPKKAS